MTTIREDGDAGRAGGVPAPAPGRRESGGAVAGGGGPEPGGRAGPVGRARAAAAFVRLSALGGTGALVAAGGLSAPSPPSGPAVGRLALLGLGFHLFAYVGNDVADLPVDRTDPRRRASPLVTGAVAPAVALAVGGAGAVASLAAVAAGAGAPGGPAGVPAVAAALAGLAAYNRWGKRAPWPPATDLVQALGWAALVAASAVVAGGPTTLTAWLGAFTVAFVLLANGVHGSLRDLANDRRCGVRSTAIAAGATVGAGGAVVVPARLRRYALALHWAAAAAAAGGLLAAPGRPPAGATATALAVTALAALGGHLLLGAAAGQADPGAARAAGMTHLVLLLGLPLVAVAPRLPAAAVAALAAAYLAPLAAHGWTPSVARWAWRPASVARRAWRSRAAAPLRLTRAANAAVAGAASVLGAYLAGGAAVLSRPPAWLGAVAVGLVVAFANALNDLTDVEVDRRRRPQRPLVAGRMTGRAAAAVAAGSAVGALAAAAALPPAPVAMVVGNLGLSALYCRRLKGTVLVGNLTVALMCATALPFGALVVGGRLPPALLAGGLVLAFMVPYEMLKDVDDGEADGAAGLRTVATVLGPTPALRVARALPLALVAVAVAGWRLGVAPAAYLAAAVPATLGPAVLAAALVRGRPAPAAVRAAVAVLKAGWLTGLAAMVLLR